MRKWSGGATFSKTCQAASSLSQAPFELCSNPLQTFLKSLEALWSPSEAPTKLPWNPLHLEAPFKALQAPEALLKYQRAGATATDYRRWDSGWSRTIFFALQHLISLHVFDDDTVTYCILGKSLNVWFGFCLGPAPFFVASLFCLLAKRKSGWGICGSFLVAFFCFVFVVWFGLMWWFASVLGPHVSFFWMLFTAYSIVRTVPSANGQTGGKKKTWSPSEVPFKSPWSPLHLEAPLKPFSSPLEAPLKPFSSPLEALLKPPSSPLRSLHLQAPFKPFSSPLKAPLKPFSSRLEAPFKSLKASQRWSPLQAPFKPPWEGLEAPLEAPLTPPWSPLQALEGFTKVKPPSSPLQAPLRRAWSPPWSPPFKPLFKPSEGEGYCSF